VGDGKAQHCVAEKFERLVVDDSPRRVLMRPRPVRERMFEEAEVAKVVADALFQRAERLAEASKLRGRGFVEVPGNQLACLLRRRPDDADPELGVPEADRKDRRRERGGHHRVDAVRRQEAAHDLDLDRGAAAENLDARAWRRRIRMAGRHASASRSILITIIVMSSCGSASPTNARTSRTTRSRMPAASRSRSLTTTRASAASPKSSPSAFIASVMPSVYSTTTSPGKRQPVYSSRSCSKRSPAPGKRRPSTMPSGAMTRLFSPETT